jgi:hypothetical protein
VRGMEIVLHHAVSDDLEAGYVQMAADAAAEAEAFEWIEALIADVADEPQ